MAVSGRIYKVLSRLIRITDTTILRHRFLHCLGGIQ